MISMNAAERAVSPARTSLVEDMIDTVRSERRLLDELSTIMERQRASVAASDLEGVDGSVFAVQRVLLTLGEARKRRRTLSERLGCPVTAPRALCEALGSLCSESLGRACRELEESARRLSREVSVNRRVLQQGIAQGEELIRLMAGAAPRHTAYPDSQVSEAVLVNRHA